MPPGEALSIVIVAADIHSTPCTTTSDSIVSVAPDSIFQVSMASTVTVPGRFYWVDAGQAMIQSTRTGVSSQGLVPSAASAYALLDASTMTTASGLPAYPAMSSMMGQLRAAPPIYPV